MANNPCSLTEELVVQVQYYFTPTQPPFKLKLIENYCLLTVDEVMAFKKAQKKRQETKEAAGKQARQEPDDGEESGSEDEPERPEGNVPSV